MDKSKMTLDEYARTIVKPMVIESIKAGKLDEAITDIDIWSIVAKDEELIKATVERLQFLIANPSQSVFTEYKIGSYLKVKLPNDYMANNS